MESIKSKVLEEVEKEIKHEHNWSSAYPQTINIDVALRIVEKAIDLTIKEKDKEINTLKERIFTYYGKDVNALEQKIADLERQLKEKDESMTGDQFLILCKEIDKATLEERQRILAVIDERIKLIDEIKYAGTSLGRIDELFNLKRLLTDQEGCSKSKIGDGKNG